MATLAIAAVGAAVGYGAAATLGFSTVLGAQIGWGIGAFLGAPKAKTQYSIQAPLADLRVTGVEYGQTIPWVRGHPRIAPQIWWASSKRAIPRFTVTETGGKGGGGGQQINVSYTYEVDLLLGLTCHPLAGFTRVWLDGQLVYCTLSAEILEYLSGGTVDGDALFAANAAANAATDKWQRITFYGGDQDQLPDPTYEAAVGSDVALAYRGRGSLFIQGLQLGQSGQLPVITVEVFTAGSTDPFYYDFAAAGGSKSAHGTNDATSWSAGGNLPVSTPLTIVANGQTIVAAGDQYIYVSFDNGVTWADKTPVGTLTITMAAYSPTLDRYLLIGTTNQGIYHSDDGGVTFIKEANSWPDGGHKAGLVWSPVLEKFCIAPSDSNPLSDHYFATSPSGLAGTWSYHSHGLGDTFEFNQMIWDEIESQLLAFPIAGSNVYSSVSGTSFAIKGALPSSGKWTAVAMPELGSIFAAKDSSTVGAISTDGGATWTAVTLPFNSQLLPFSIAWNGVALVLVPNNAGLTSTSLYYSLTGQTGSWTAATMPAIAYTVVAAGAKIAAVIGVYDDIPVHEVMRDLCLWAGFDAQQFDVTQLEAITREVRSFEVGQITPTRGPAEVLATFFYFDATVSDKLHFVPRGGAAAATIAYDEMGAVFGDEATSEDGRLALQIRNDIERPLQLAVSFRNILKDYNTLTVYSDRSLEEIRTNVQEMQAPLGLTSEEAIAVANTSVMDQAIAATTGRVDVLADGDFALLEPTDVIVGTSKDGSSFRLRIVKVTETYPVRSLEVVLDDASILQNQGITTAVFDSSITVNIPANTLMVLLDIPLLRDGDDDGTGHYTVMKGDRAPWPGGVLMKSVDDVSFTPRATVTETGIFGDCTTTMPGWSGARVLDEMSSLTVDVGAGVTLSSVAREDALDDNTLNACLIGVHGRWEAAQFCTATQVSDGVYTLTRWLRGSRGTEWTMNSHVAGETFVLLRLAGVRHVPMDTPEVGLLRYYRAVTMDRPLDSATSEEFTNSGVIAKPFSLADIRAERDPSSGDVTFTVQLRSRRAVRMIGPLGISVPLGEESLSVELDIVGEDSPGTAVLRTLSSTTTTLTYTAAQQAEDNITGQVTVQGYQLSALVGRGYVKERTLL